MTERTYKKDLDILNTWFQDELPPENVESLQPLFQLIESMTQHHGVFLRDLEHRILLWENRNMTETHHISDIMLKSMVVLPVYVEFFESHREFLERLNDLYETDESFQQIYREFEQQKICYVPIGTLVLKPLHRLLHYQLILEKLVEYYAEDQRSHTMTDCQGALVMLSRATENIRQNLEESENFQLLCELQRDFGGIVSLVNNNRLFIRQGCLLKHSKRGLQQRIFFLFSDVLLYGSKSPVNQQFKVLGHVPLRSLITENAEHNGFMIFGGQKVITVSAGTTAEKTLWLAELAKASAEIKSKPHVQLSLGTLKNCSSSEEGLESCGTQSSNKSLTGNTNTATAAVRSNNAIHVCWHRGATIGMRDFIVSSENQLSGYLLRKFKNSSGWQKLWVVFTSFCLYFYKNYQDEFALASLPLLGYSVGPPSFQDTIQKEFVFKLSFKNHVYFFRADSQHTYNRWMEVLSSTTHTQSFKNTRNAHQ